MKRHIAALLLSSALYGQELSCDQLKVQQTFQSTLMDGCRDKIELYGGCGAYIIGPEHEKIDVDGKIPYRDLKKLHQKQVTVTGTYYPNYPLYLTQCDKSTPYRGAPQRFLEITMIQEIKPQK